MTTKARKRTKNSGFMKIGIWNVRGLYGKEKLLLKELKKANVDIAVISEIKKKLIGLQKLEDYILLYGGVPTNKIAAAGIAIMIKAKYRKLHVCKKRILQLRYKLQRGYLTLLAVYAPEEGKTEQTEEFYKTLQHQIGKINKNDCIIVAGDCNARRVGKIPIDRILGTNGEITINSNGHKLKDFVSVNELKIMNTFFRLKEIHKMMWNARGYRCIIDYILTNKKLPPLVQDTKFYSGYNVATDHYLLISKICLPQKRYTFIKRTP
jgi:exonuclease III